MSDRRTTSGLAVVLLSGGLDSCVTAALAARSHTLALLHATYGQRTAARERRAFDEIAAHFAVPASRRLIVELQFLARLGGSALTDPSIPIPVGAPGAGVPATYVPFRNAHLLCAAISWAETLGAESIWIGAVEQDGSGYPDCREAFFSAFERAARLGTRDGQHLRIETPLVRLSKREIVRTGIELRAPLELTWSCYRSQTRACGRCESCRLRLRGFRQAGVADPLPYES